MYTLPQEIEVWYIIPAIRREISFCLSKDYGVSYDNIGKILGISKAAVSQYIRKKRAAKIKLHPEAMKEIDKSCKFISKRKSNSLIEITRILNVIKKKKLHCEICGKIIDDNLHDCKEIKIPVINIDSH